MNKEIYCFVELFLNFEMIDEVDLEFPVLPSSSDVMFGEVFQGPG